MPTMNTRTAWALLSVIALATLASWEIYRLTAAPIGPQEVTDSPTAPVPPLIDSENEKSSKKVEKVEVRKPMSPPPELHDFYLKTPEQRLDEVTSLQSNPTLSKGVTKFLEEAIRDKSHDEVTRNNMANCLLGQDHPDPYLHRIFLAMIDDPTESYQWREYCVQHLARTVPTSAEPQRAIKKLSDLMDHGEKGIRGTALLHLHRLNEKGAFGLDSTYTSRVIALLNDPQADILTRITAIGVLAEREEKMALPIIRDIAKGSDSSLKRVALAALGSLGDQTDENFLRQEVDRNAKDGTAEAAAGALEVMKKKLSESQPPKEQTPEKF